MSSLLSYLFGLLVGDLWIECARLEDCGRNICSQFRAISPSFSDWKCVSQCRQSWNGGSKIGQGLRKPRKISKGIFGVQVKILREDLEKRIKNVVA
jgi:hypothetical protein